MRRLLIATHNAHKTAEFGAMLGADWEVADLSAYPEVAAPEETGDTFAANAEIKALAATAIFSGLVLADDSGLEVDALGGAPGVRSARYAGEGASDAKNRHKLLEALRQQPEAPRTARFKCVLVLARQGLVLRRFEGAVEGTLLTEERGEGGFGYDPLFVPNGYEETFAELSSRVKNEESHRARAMRQAVEFMREQPAGA
jgi:XTP/dITP diphosphohydrolase